MSRLMHVIMHTHISYTHLCVRCVDTACNLVHVLCVCVMLQSVRQKVQNCGKVKLPIAGVLYSGTLI